MSRFFTAGDSSSESSSSDEEELYSEEENEQKSEEESDDQDEASEDEDSSSEDSDMGGKSGASQFLVKNQIKSDDSEDEDKVTIVKSAKDKRLEELETVARLIENAQKINDWSSISTGQAGSLTWIEVFKLTLDFMTRIRQAEPPSRQAGC